MFGKLVLGLGLCVLVMDYGIIKISFCGPPVTTLRVAEVYSLPSAF